MKTAILSILFSILLKLLFYRSPRLTFSDEEISEYEELFSKTINGDGLVQYTSSFPKHRFIQYVALNKNVLLHGSNNLLIQEFETRRQTLYNGEIVNAVFATKDGIWPVFYAVFDKNKLYGNIRNGCLSSRKGEKYHFYSISHESSLDSPWTNGMIYFFPMDTFQKSSDEIISFDEWVSRVPVKPIGRIEVGITDFYFYHRVSVHNSKEPLSKTWMMFKARNLISKACSKNSNDDRFRMEG